MSVAGQSQETSELTSAARGRRASYAAGARCLSGREPVLARLAAAAGPPRLGPRLESPFAALVRSVLHQQLAGPAAAAIHGRLVAALDGAVTPAALGRVTSERLREIGLSGGKAASLLDLAAKVGSGQVVLEPRRLARRSDEELIAELTKVRGIGRWTVQMLLMFQLRRLDVWPAGDLGVRRGFGLAFDVPMPSERELEAKGTAFVPYRSVAAWYCWRACELYGGAGPNALTR